MVRFPGRNNAEWETPKDLQWSHVSIEVLMDIREELRRLNQLLHCHNFLAIPRKLDAISRNTSKPKRKRKVLT